MNGFEGFKPLGNRVLVERLPARRSGVILLTDDGQSRFFKVLAKGPRATEIEEGDVVFLPGVASDHPDFEENGLALVTEADMVKVGGY